MKNSIISLIKMSEPLVKPLVGKGVEISTTAALGDPFVGAIIGGIASEKLDTLYGSISTEFEKRNLTTRESQKVGATLSFAVLEIKENFGKQKSLREDYFFDLDEFQESPYEEIAEAVYLKVQKEFEKKKIKYYGNYLANIAFDETVSKEEANKLVNLIESLTYRQIKLIALFSGQTIFARMDRDMYEEAKKIGMEVGIIDQSIFPKFWDLPERDFRQQGTMHGYHTISLYQDLLDLMQLGLLVQYTPESEREIIIDIMQLNPKKIAINGMGAQLYNLMKLEQIPEEEIKDLCEQL